MLERKRTDLEHSLSHQGQTAQQTAAAHESLMKDVSGFTEWLREMLISLQQPAPVGVSVADGEAAQQQHYVSDNSLWSTWSLERK